MLWTAATEKSGVLAMVPSGFGPWQAAQASMGGPPAGFGVVFVAACANAAAESWQEVHTMAEGASHEVFTQVPLVATPIVLGEEQVCPTPQGTPGLQAAFVLAWHIVQFREVLWREDLGKVIDATRRSDFDESPRVD